MQRIGFFSALAIASVSVLPLLVPQEAAASTLEVQFSGMDLFMGFDGKRNIQTGPSAGQTDQMEAATFYVDGVSIGTIVGDISANVGVPGFDIPVSGGSDSNNYTAGYFSLDFDTADHTQGWLDLAVDDSFIVTAYYTGDEIGMSIIGRNTGVKHQQDLDRLPTWPGFNHFDTIKFSFSSSNLSDVQDDGSVLTRFHAKGSGTLDQTTVIPEPASIGLAGLAGLTLLRRRRN